MSKIVCVTGASGYVAGPLIQLLLENGYNVRGTVRNLSDNYKVQHLHTLSEKYSGSLELFEADLMKEGSFEKAIDGCTYVFHTASPFQVNVEDPQRDLVDPALKGTRNVLQTVAKFKDQVKRVILTSSVAAVSSSVGKAEPKNGVIMTEEDWNKLSTIENDPYCYSKTVAEEEAWRFAKENGLDLVVINPSFVLGPSMFKRIDGMSMKWMKAMLEGEERPGRFGTVDVRDIAKAHFNAMENPNAKGRYIVSSRKKLNPGESAAILKEAFPKFNINVDGNKKHDVLNESDFIDNSKVIKELNVDLIPLKQTLVDMAKSFIDLGIVTLNE